MNDFGRFSSVSFYFFGNGLRLPGNKVRYGNKWSLLAEGKKFHQNIISLAVNIYVAAPAAFINNTVPQLTQPTNDERCFLLFRFWFYGNFLSKFKKEQNELSHAFEA